MKTICFLLLIISSCTCAEISRAESSAQPVDFDKARQIFERMNKGETVSADEKAYVERAKAEHARRGAGKPGDGGAASGIDWEKAKVLHQREQRGEKLADEEQRYLDRAKAARGQRPGGGSGGRAGGGAQRKAPEHLVPLTDMAASDKYEGEDGGLYGGGSNQPPVAQRKAAEDALALIKPLDAGGKPSADGRIVFISISMSNATMEFSAFKRIADAAPQKSAKVTVVDCAQGGQAMAAWSSPDAHPWGEALSRLERAGVTPQQVQAAWIKLANAGPSGTMKEHLDLLEADTVSVLQLAQQKFPNLRVAYLGSRIWAGNASTGLNPEPYAYEGAFACRHLIQKQMNGDAALAAGKVPVLLWGPYLWAEGTKGRKTDNLVWTAEDFGRDGTHPSESGREKVAKQLLDFFSTDPLAKGWFAK
ncbi:MAG: hypothetical protein K1X78_14305 [Verrucomicrobiaceae bacterium]|nr:hypothetical protein [Verrucomicrobiaceae bacterium]